MPGFTSSDWYEALPQALVTGAVDLTTAPVRVALLAGSYVFDRAAHTSWADVQAHEIAGPGYTAGGALLTSSWAGDWSAYTGELTAPPVEWPGADFTFRAAVAYLDLGATAADKTLIHWWGLAADEAVTGTAQFALAGGLLVGVYL